MFVGGLNWETSDGTYIVISCILILSTVTVALKFISPYSSRLTFLDPISCSLFPPLSSSWFVIEALREYFTQFGKVDACTIMRDSAGRSRCFAFLTFEEAASVNAVMSREHFLDGKIVRGSSIRSFICCLFLLSVGPCSSLPLSSTRFTVLFLALLSFFVHAVPHTDRRPPSFVSFHVCRSTRSALSRGRNTKGPQNSS